MNENENMTTMESTNTEETEQKKFDIKGLVKSGLNKAKKPLAVAASVAVGYGLKALVDRHNDKKALGCECQMPESYMSIDQDGTMDQIQ